jgi:hypothetical protein
VRRRFGDLPAHVLDESLDPRGGSARHRLVGGALGSGAVLVVHAVLPVVHAVLPVRLRGGNGQCVVDDAQGLEGVQRAVDGFEHLTGAGDGEPAELDEGADQTEPLDVLLARNSKITVSSSRSRSLAGLRRAEP